MDGGANRWEQHEEPNALRGDEICISNTMTWRMIVPGPSLGFV